MPVIGHFGQHLCNSIVHKINITLRNNQLAKVQHQDDGTTKIKYVISEAALEAIYNLLCKRPGHFQSSHADFQLTSKYAAHFKHVRLRGKGTFTGESLLSVCNSS